MAESALRVEFGFIRVLHELFESLSIRHCQPALVRSTFHFVLHLHLSFLFTIALFFHPPSSVHSNSTMADPVAIDASRASPGLWDRVSTWVSENKAVAYTIAGTVVVITSAGAIYYFSGQKSPSSSTSTEKRKSKKERRKEKKAAEEAQKAGISLKDEEAGESRYL